MAPPTPNTTCLIDSMWPLPRPLFSCMMPPVLSSDLFFLYYLKMEAASSSNSCQSTRCHIPEYCKLCFMFYVFKLHVQTTIKNTAWDGEIPVLCYGMFCISCSYLPLLSWSSGWSVCVMWLLCTSPSSLLSEASHYVLFSSSVQVQLFSW
jgi:hypothetical protein